MNDHSRSFYVESAKAFRQKRYLLVTNILPDVVLDYLRVYYRVLLTNKTFFRDSVCPSSLSLRGDSALDAVLGWIRPEISRLVGFELAPTYSYTRQYAKGDALPRHVDRPSCEISVTLSIRIPRGAGPSVIYLRAPNSRTTKVELFEGDGCIYAGIEVQHWRQRFPVGGYIQLFLHYIARRGPYYPKLLFDRRKSLGSFKKGA
jgi:hypothetical protein